ncbi:MAG: 4Fe-4S dicluster domain-containing protein [Chloroflexi bacterium]|nr:4Fe-4S dicluster domain-containing protein [Chloroflexota bacterium]
MTRWGMVIDLQKCIGCYSCVVACKSEHFLPPEIWWNRVLKSESGKYPAVTKEILPVLCNHCKDAPCVDACPTGATTKREDGIVTVDSTKCAGCRYCLIACPYQNRTFYDNKREEYFPGQGLTPLEEMGKKLYPLEPGTVVKCNFCVERIDGGLQRGLKPGVDREATPACVIACPTHARTFGDLDDPDSEISILIATKRALPSHPEFDTDPSVYYVKR